MRKNRATACATACSATRSQRAGYAIIAVVMLAFGISLLNDSIIIGVAGLVIAVGATIMAITGLCLPDWLALRNHPPKPDDEVLGFASAPEPLTLTQPAKR